MKETISIHIGQCGIQIGARFWDIIRQEHELSVNGESSEGTQNINNFFDEGLNGNYHPRAIFTDLDTRAVDNIKAGTNGAFFSPNSFIASDTPSCNNFAVGKYIEGSHIEQQVLEKIRHQSEKSDSLSSFLVTQAMGGGTGSGLSSIIFQRLDEGYRINPAFNFSVFPNKKYSLNSLEPYNFVLAMSSIYNYTDIMCPADNESLINICMRNYDIAKPRYSDVNNVISSCISDFTAGNRFSGALNFNMKKIATNLVPFFYNHFIIPTISVKGQTITEINDEIFNRMNMLCCNKIDDVITSAALYRGEVYTGEVEREIYNIRNKYSASFNETISSDIFIGMSKKKPLNRELSGNMFLNSRSILNLIDEQIRIFDIMYSKKAFLHWFTQEGIDEMEFNEARSFLEDIHQCYNTINHHPDGGEE